MTPDQVAQALLKTDDWLPANVQRLRIGDELGDLDCEAKGATGYLAGIKRYYFESDGKTKAATHGLPALPKAETLRMIENLATGKDAAYHSKEKPLKAKEAGSADRIGAFESRDYVSGFHLDQRLNWIETEGGWVGSVRDFIAQGVKEMQENPRTLANYKREMDKLLNQDVMMQRCRENGFIRIPSKYDFYHGDYLSLSSTVKRKYFRKSREALTLDEFADAGGWSANELILKLRERG
jgi:hypothetical protein